MLLESQKRFRRLRGHRLMPVLLQALGRASITAAQARA